MANLDLPKKGASSKWSLEDDSDEDESETTNGKSNKILESEEEDPLGNYIPRRERLGLIEKQITYSIAFHLQMFFLNLFLFGRCIHDRSNQTS